MQIAQQGQRFQTHNLTTDASIERQCRVHMNKKEARQFDVDIISQQHLKE